MKGVAPLSRLSERMIGRETKCGSGHRSHRVADPADSVEDVWPVSADSPPFPTLVREQSFMAASHPPSGYDRSQNGSICLLLYLMAIFTGLLSWLARGDQWFASILLGSALMMLMVAASFTIYGFAIGANTLRSPSGRCPCFAASSDTPTSDRWNADG